MDRCIEVNNGLLGFIIFFFWGGFYFNGDAGDEKRCDHLVGLLPSTYKHDAISLLSKLDLSY